MEDVVVWNGRFFAGGEGLESELGVVGADDDGGVGAEVFGSLKLFVGFS